MKKPTPATKPKAKSGGKPAASPRGKPASRAPAGGGGTRHPWLKLLLAVLVLACCALAYVDEVVKEKFTGKKWALPAKVYARPLELYAGLTLPRGEVLRELRALGYHEGSGNQAGIWQVTASGLEVHTRGFRFWDSQEPPRHLHLDWQGDTLTTLGVSGADVIRLEPLHIGGIYPAHNEDRLLVRLQDVPPLLTKGLIEVEDRSFYDHFGISLRGIARAMWVNAQSGRMAQGGSTLTQQLVKNFYLSQERTLGRKMLEAVMSVLLDFHFSKDEILEAYMNEVYLGQSGPREIHGFGLASMHYFNRPVNELELHQIALLVGIVKGPSEYNPWRHPDRALERRNLVLDVMAEEKIISEAQATAAKAHDLDVAGSSRGGQPGYPAYLDLVARQLQRDYRPEDLSSEGLQIFTAFDPRVQWQSESALTGVLTQIETRRKMKPDTLEGAVIVTDPGTGEVQAVVGGREARYAGFNRVLDAERPIGSVIKPMVYLTALENGWTLASVLEDKPLSVKGPKGTVWSPLNYDRHSHGNVLLVSALDESLNQATARLGLQVGVGRVVATVHRLGIDKPLQPLPSLLLGAVEMTPLEVATMYQTIAANGFHSPLRSIREVLDINGKPLKRYPLTMTQKISPEAAFLLQYAMVGVVREGTGRPLANILPPERIVAGKTGTTDDQRDSWFAGFSGDRLAVVWVGRDDNQPTPLTGATGALPVWGEIMRYSRESLSLTPPDRIDYHTVDRSTGAITGRACPDAVMLPFVKGTEPQTHTACEDEAGGVMDWLRKLVP